MSDAHPDWCADDRPVARRSRRRPRFAGLVAAPWLLLAVLLVAEVVDR